MKIKEIVNLDVKEKEKYVCIFKKVLREITEKTFIFVDREEREYSIVHEKRLNSHFVHIVPQEVKEIFECVRQDNPEAFLGFSVLVGKKDGEDVRLSCFGIPCSFLTKAIT